MGHKDKKGKQRKDGFYRKAKVAGYRARSAYKLIQLNTKYKFLQSARVCIDLCAAPGSWTQVASKFMPVSSVIIAVDLFPIRPIPNAITIQGDITTDSTSQDIKNNLKTWKADLILHDGAPNVGSSWIQDSYNQNVLVLHSFKLACQFLRKGGTFITKVFRSKDHFSLEYVFRKLFKRVEATKPIASRHQSAEIYIICLGYLAPDKVDPQFFDPKHVFVSLDNEPKNKINIHKPVTTKQKPEGYEEGIAFLFKRYKISDFLFNPQFTDVLESANELVWDLPEAKDSFYTTPEIIELCKDIKVLNRKDLRQLLNWRTKIKAEIGERQSLLPVEEEESIEKIPEEEKKDDVDLELQEIEKVQEEVDELKARQAREEKQRKKKVDKSRKKLADKQSLQLMVPGDSGPQETDKSELFQLNMLNNVDVDDIVDQSTETIALSKDEGPLKVPKKMLVSKKGVYSSEYGSYRKEIHDETSDESEDSEEDEEEDGLNINEETEKKTFKSVRFADEDDDDELPEGDDNPFLTDLVGNSREERQERRAEKWFDKSVFSSLDKEELEDYELDKAIVAYKKQGMQLYSRPSATTEDTIEEETPHGEESGFDTHTLEDVATAQGEESVVDTPNLGNVATPVGFEVADAPELDRKDSDVDTDSDSSEDEKPRAPPQKKNRKHKLDEVGLALATKMIHSKKAKRDIYDESWNRYMYGDESLPDWFDEDEKKHNQPRVEVDKEDLQLYQERNKAVNSKSMKKVVEAKARKQRRLKKSMNRARKRADVIANSADMSQREKASEIKKMYTKASSSLKKKKKTYVVMKKHFGGRKPKAAKGPTKLVDKRLKKDTRAKERVIKKRSKAGRKKK